jgi:serine/arginine repetitive matrix protein 1
VAVLLLAVLFSMRTAPKFVVVPVCPLFFSSKFGMVNVNSHKQAPGTFGFNHTKYRPPQEDIPMDEFGQQDDVQEEDDDGEVPRNLHERRPSRDAAPFSSYAPPDPRLMDPKANGAAQRQQQQQKGEVEDEQDAGCCKCVIM